MASVRLLAIGAALHVVAVVSAGAQTGQLHGLVVDSVGAPVRDADIAVVALRRLTRTDSAGWFALARLAIGTHEVSVRRLGFEPSKFAAHVDEVGHDTIRVVLTRSAVLLAGIHVSASDQRRREQIEEFYRRRARGLGDYVTRDDIDERASGSPSDMLRTVPGLRFVKVASGRGVRFPTTSLSRRDCAPMIWIDGQKAPGLEIDDVTLTDIEGIEIYSGPSTTPFQFSQAAGGVTCGTIVVWSRPPTPRRAP